MATQTSSAAHPLIGLTCDLDAERHFLRRPYVRAVLEAGGVPVLLPACDDPDVVARLVDRCDGIVLTGGDDPRMERFGHATHREAVPVDPARQSAELAVLAHLDARPAVPVLGICLGMQYMALHAGGDLDQHLPETCSTADVHWGHRPHRISGSLGDGDVSSHHRQAVCDPGSLDVVATAPDGVIEAVADPSRPYFLGVQWHPERTADPALGVAIVAGLVAAAREA